MKEPKFTETQTKDALKRARSELEPFTEPYERGGNNAAPTSEIISGLYGLSLLTGNWSTQRNSKSGYNVMPLPQKNKGEDLNFIFKNFFYYETMKFDLLGKVPNRGGTYEQDCYTLLYDQRVFFAEGPKKDVLVHAENGAWLRQEHAYQFPGPYENQSVEPISTDVPPQKIFFLTKQTTVPHGNSILMNGTIDVGPEIKIEKISGLPTGGSPELQKKLHKFYEEQPDREIILNPNKLLQAEVDKINKSDIDFVVTLKLEATNKVGGIVNIPFIQNHANVKFFETVFWIITFKNSTSKLLYTQTAGLQFLQEDLGLKDVIFKHIDVNILTRSAPI